MTKTSTAPKCYFCETAPATHVKRDTVLEGRDDENGQCLPDAEVTTVLLICLDCEDKHYDGTEIHPGVLALA